VVQALMPYIKDQCAKGGKLSHVTRHILGLFQGQPGAARWRRHLSEHAHYAKIEMVEKALKLMVA